MFTAHPEGNTTRTTAVGKWWEELRRSNDSTPSRYNRQVPFGTWVTSGVCVTGITPAVLHAFICIPMNDCLKFSFVGPYLSGSGLDLHCWMVTTSTAKILFHGFPECVVFIEYLIQGGEGAKTRMQTRENLRIKDRTAIMLAIKNQECHSGR